jgi:hypothetical protein
MNPATTVSPSPCFGCPLEGSRGRLDPDSLGGQPLVEVRDDLDYHALTTSTAMLLGFRA